VRYNEPPHVKHLKVALLPLITNAENVREIASELGEYVTDVDSELSQRAIAAMGEIAVRVSDVSGDMTQRLVELVDLDVPYVKSEAIKVLGNVIKIYPSMRVHVLPSLSRYLKKAAEDPEAKAVLVWILGEYGDEVIEAPYLLEPIIDEYDEETSPTVKLHTLSAAVKLFFKRAPEMQAMLGRLLVSAVNDTSNQDVHDKALLYYRLLAHSPEGASGLFQRTSDDSNSHVPGEVEDGDTEALNQVFREFDTLSVIYGKPCEQFIADQFVLNMASADLARQRRLDAVAAGVPVEPANSNSAPTPAQEPVKATPAASVNLLDWDDEPSPASRPTQQLSPLVLSPCELSPPEFQQKWGGLPEALNSKICTLAMVPDATSEVEASMRDVQVSDVRLLYSAQ